jgi:ParB-like chromosome segregation protein Spo0J
MKAATVATERKALADLNEAPYNPNRMTDTQLSKLGKSIKTFDYLEPIVWNRQTGHVVSGNHRLRVLRDQGFTEADVVVVDVSPDQERLINIAMNKIHGQVDARALVDVLQEYSPEDIGLTGYDQDEFESIMERAMSAQADAEAGVTENESRGLGNPIIQFNLVFDDEQQQKRWYDFLKMLKDAHTGDTVAARLDEHITEYISENVREG